MRAGEAVTLALLLLSAAGLEVEGVGDSAGEIVSLAALLFAPVEMELGEGLNIAATGVDADGLERDDGGDKSGTKTVPGDDMTESGGLLSLAGLSSVAVAGDASGDALGVVR